MSPRGRRVAPVILSPGHRMPVAKAIELLGIEREDMQAPVEQGIDDGAAGHFDGHRDPAGLRRSQRRELIGQGGESYAGVRDATLADELPVGAQHAHHVRRASPIHTHKNWYSDSDIMPPFPWSAPPWCHVIPVLALKAQLPTGCPPRLPRWGAVHCRC
jgi:hypothetical protein